MRLIVQSRRWPKTIKQFSDCRVAKNWGLTQLRKFLRRSNVFCLRVLEKLAYVLRASDARLRDPAWTCYSHENADYKKARGCWLGDCAWREFDDEHLIGDAQVDGGG